MKKIAISLLFMAILLPVMAQKEMDTLLKEIERNSSALNALREQIAAQKLTNRTGIYLPNPEVAFNYLWGSPAPVGNRTDISITQSFDFPTAYGHRSRISKLENANLDLRYQSERLNLLMRAREVCTELVYYNALVKEYSKRLLNAQRIAETYQMRFDRGDVNILEKNKAQLELTTTGNELSRVETERSSLLNELKALNNGNAVSFTATELTYEMLPPDFEQWYAMAEAKSPVLQYVRGQIEISRQQVKLNRALGLPKFTAGYMSEKVVGERFQGVTVGISIPLWENRNRMKQAKAELKTAETVLEDNKLQFYHRLQNLFLKASRLQQEVTSYRQALSSYSNEVFLKKALESGEISLLYYLLEITYYYEAMQKMLESERELGFALAELSAVGM